MKFFYCTIFLLLANLAAFSQYTYQVKADSFRIYNTCDTAEFILENRTQDTAGFLYNKGKGRTEFRRLQLENIGDSAIAIVGQDTLVIRNLGGGRYDLLSTNYVLIPAADSLRWEQWPANKVVAYDAYNATDMPVLSSQAFKGQGQNLFYNGLVSRDGNTGFDLAVNWDGELMGPNGAFLRTKDDTQPAWSKWRELVFKDYADTAYNRGGGSANSIDSIYRIKDTLLYRTAAGTVRKLPAISDYLTGSRGVVRTGNNFQLGGQFTDHILLNSPTGSNFTTSSTGYEPGYPNSMTSVNSHNMYGNSMTSESHLYQQGLRYGQRVDLRHKTLASYALTPSVMLSSYLQDMSTRFESMELIVTHYDIEFVRRLYNSNRKVFHVDSLGVVTMHSYKNNAAGDSVLSTDVNGKLKLVAKQAGPAKAMYASIEQAGSAVYNITNDDYTVVLNPLGVARTLNLPDPATQKGRILNLHFAYAQSASYGEWTLNYPIYINGDAQTILNNGCTIQSDGTKWRKISIAL